MHITVLNKLMLSRTEIYRWMAEKRIHIGKDKNDDFVAYHFVDKSYYLWVMWNGAKTGYLINETQLYNGKEPTDREYVEVYEVLIGD